MHLDPRCSFYAFGRPSTGWYKSKSIYPKQINHGHCEMFLLNKTKLFLNKAVYFGSPCNAVLNIIGLFLQSWIKNGRLMIGVPTTRNRKWRKPVLEVRCSRLLFFTALDWRIDQKNDCHGNNLIACLMNAEIFDFTYFFLKSEVYVTVSNFTGNFISPKQKLQFSYLVFTITH